MGDPHSSAFGATEGADPEEQSIEGIRILLMLAVWAGLAVTGFYLSFGLVHCPIGFLENSSCGEREGIELVLPIGALVGGLLWRVGEVTWDDRISPRLSLLALAAFVGGVLLLIWAWSEPFPGYHPLRLLGAAVVAFAAFVVGRFHLRTAAAAVGALGPTALVSLLIIPLDGTCRGSACRDSIAGVGLGLWALALICIVAALIASAAGRNWTAHAAAWVSFIFTALAAFGFLLWYGTD